MRFLLLAVVSTALVAMSCMAAGSLKQGCTQHLTETAGTLLALRAHLLLKLAGGQQKTLVQQPQALPRVIQRGHRRAEPGCNAGVAPRRPTARYEGRQARR